METLSNAFQVCQRLRDGQRRSCLNVKLNGQNLTAASQRQHSVAMVTRRTNLLFSSTGFGGITDQLFLIFI